MKNLNQASLLALFSIALSSGCLIYGGDDAGDDDEGYTPDAQPVPRYPADAQPAIDAAIDCVAYGCSVNATCAPTEFGSNCACMDGYAGDGYACMPDANPITIFATQASTDGKLSALAGATVRNTADALCMASAGALSCPTAIHALFNVDIDDQLTDAQTHFGFSTTAPIQSANGIALAGNWNELLASQLDHSLADAGVLLPNTQWLSGGAGGTANGNDECVGWTADGDEPGSGQLLDVVGNADGQDSTWVAGGFSSCATALPLLCLCY